MKQIKDIFPIILLLLSGLASCSTDELPDNNDKEKTPVGSITSLQISVSDFKGKVNTRTSESGYQTSFTGDDQIGVLAMVLGFVQIVVGMATSVVKINMIHRTILGNL